MINKTNLVAFSQGSARLFFRISNSDISNVLSKFENTKQMPSLAKSMIFLDTLMFARFGAFWHRIPVKYKWNFSTNSSILVNLAFPKCEIASTNTIDYLHFALLCFVFAILYLVLCFVFRNFVFKEQPERAKFCQQTGSPSFTPAFIKSSSSSSYSHKAKHSTWTIPKLKYKMAKVTTRRYRPCQSHFFKSLDIMKIRDHFTFKRIYQSQILGSINFCKRLQIANLSNRI